MFFWFTAVQLIICWKAVLIPVTNLVCNDEYEYKSQTTSYPFHGYPPKMTYTTTRSTANTTMPHRIILTTRTRSSINLPRCVLTEFLLRVIVIIQEVCTATYQREYTDAQHHSEHDHTYTTQLYQCELPYCRRTAFANQSLHSINRIIAAKNGWESLLFKAVFTGIV